MKCPKCAYLSLESSDRCGYCGYEFSLVDSTRLEESRGGSRPRATPLGRPPRTRADAAAGHVSQTPRDLLGAADSVLGRPLAGAPDGAPLDLPLFEMERAPLPPPQRPLGVRRAGHATPRPRPTHVQPAAGVLPLEPESRADAGGPPASDPPRATVAAAPERRPATALRRLGAALVDACAVTLVNALTLYFTLRVAGLEPAAWPALPWLPVGVFFAVLNGGYTILLTATLGQTLGKMAFDVEVVADGQPAVGVARATLRTVLACVSLAPAGIGLLWILHADRRALHDRLSGTRVVSAAA